jgi:hypothetical protein
VLIAAKLELRKVLKDKARHPSTYNHYFTTTIQKMRQRKHHKLVNDAMAVSTEEMHLRNNSWWST